MSGTPHLHAEGFKAASIAADRRLRIGGMAWSSRLVEELTRDILRAYVPYARKPPSKGFDKYSPETRKIAKLFVGQSVVCPIVSKQTMYSRFKGARKILENGDARWSVAFGLTDAVVTRIEDGTVKSHDPWRRKAGVAIAKIPVGGWALVMEVGVHDSLPQPAKHAARLILGNMAADWRLKNTPEGPMVTRTR